MKSLREKLGEGGILLADGAWGTELIRRGVRSGDCLEALNTENPEIVKDVASSYCEAGADIVLSNTFGGSRLKLRAKGLEDKAEMINEAGVRLSREGAPGCFVFGSIGPTGGFLEPAGTISRDEMISYFLPQARGIVNGGADGVVIETMSDAGEAECALEAVRELSDIPVAVTMTFEKGAGGFATIMGITPERMVARFSGNTDLLGANCGSGIELMLEMIKSFEDAPGVWIKPNAGSPELRDGEVFYNEKPEEMARHLKKVKEAGVKVFGGCCGTSPEYIREFRRTLDGL